MSYTRSQPGVALGAVQPVLETVRDVMSDPYLKETTCLVQQLHSMEEGQGPGAACPQTTPNLRGGVGLREAVGPLRMYIEHKKRPWIAPLIVTGVLWLTFSAGVAAGRGRRR